MARLSCSGVRSIWSPRSKSASAKHVSLGLVAPDRSTSCRVLLVSVEHELPSCVRYWRTAVPGHRMAPLPSLAPFRRMGGLGNWDGSYGVRWWVLVRATLAWLVFLTAPGCGDGGDEWRSPPDPQASTGGGAPAGDGASGPTDGFECPPGGPCPPEPCDGAGCSPPGC